MSTRRELLDAALKYATEYGWAVFPLGVKSKTPLPGSNGHLEAATNRKQIKRWWKSEPYNIGIACSWQDGPIVLDVDGTDGKELLKSLGKLRLTLKARSGKKGTHYYYMPDDGEPLKRTIKIQGEHLDLLSEGGYVVAPPSIHPDTGRPYKWLNEHDPIELPQKIRNLVIRKGTQGRNGEPTELRLPDIIHEGERDDTLFRYACLLRSRGLEEDSILDDVRRENAVRCQPPLDDAQLRKLAGQAAKYPPGMEKALHGLNEVYAVVQIGNDVVILQERSDDEIAFLQPKDFRLLVRKEGFFELGARGRMKRVSLAEAWLDWAERREFFSVVFKPGESDIPAEEFNLWRGWTIEPNAKGNCTLFLRHLQDVVCRGDKQHYEFFLDWLADLVQNPMRKLGITVALKGKQGAGKSFVGYVMKRLLGPLQVVVEKQHHVIGRFNAHLARCLLLQSEEAFWAGDKGAGVLKHLVTSETMLVERKGIDQVEMPNYTRLLITSNDDWVWPTDLDDRRLVIFDVSPKYRKNKTYFKRLFRQMDERNGYGKLLDLLLTRKINARRLENPPRTQALEEQAIHSMTAEETWLLDLLTSGTIDEGMVDGKDRAHVLIGVLYESYVASLPKGRRYVKNPRAFGIFVKQHLPRVKGVKYQWKNRFWNARLGKRAQSMPRVIRPLDECRERYSRRGRAAPQKWGKPTCWRIRKD